MTLIIGYKNKDGIWVGGEAKASDGDEAFYVAEPKVFAKGPFTYGFAGSFRFGQILQYCFDAPSHPGNMDDYTYLVSRWLRVLQGVLADNGGVKITEGIANTGDGSCIMVYRDSIYVLQEDFAILKLADPYVALGAGSTCAMGALWALQKMSLPGEKLVDLALEAGAMYTPSCGGKKTIIKHQPARRRRGRPRR